MARIRCVAILNPGAVLRVPIDSSSGTELFLDVNRAGGEGGALVEHRHGLEESHGVCGHEAPGEGGRKLALKSARDRSIRRNEDLVAIVMDTYNVVIEV